jgi:hypothetical protein
MNSFTINITSFYSFQLQNVELFSFSHNKQKITMIISLIWFSTDNWEKEEIGEILK